MTDVAKLWYCLRGHICDLIAAGKLHSVDFGIGRAKTRIPESALDEYVKAHTRPVRGRIQL